MPRPRARARRPRRRRPRSGELHAAGAAAGRDAGANSRCPPSSRPDRRELTTGLYPHRTDALVAAAEAAADVAGAVVRPFSPLRLSSEAKHDRSPVTIADRSAEQAMRAVLTERFRSTAFWARSSGSTGRKPGLRWVLDPIDGTRAFITGRPCSARSSVCSRARHPFSGSSTSPSRANAGSVSPAAGPFSRRSREEPWAAGPARRSPMPNCPARPRTCWEFTGPARERLATAVRRTSWGGDCYAYGLLALGRST